MPVSSFFKNGKKIPLLTALIGAFVLGLIATIGGFIFAADQEQHDIFCTSCHTQPENTFYQRSKFIRPVDLASYHADTQLSCIDCHAGTGFSGRISAELLGARNAFKWYTGTAVQPATLSYPFTDQTCLQCHPSVIQQGFSPKKQFIIPGISYGERDGEGQYGHWHQFLLPWQAVDPKAAACVTCHSGHHTDAQARAGFMNANMVQSTCDACHKVLRRGAEG